MHVFSTLIIALCISFIVASTVTTVKPKRQFNEAMESFLKKHNKGVKHRQTTDTTKNLRMEKIALESSNNNVNKKGWFESVIYSQTWYKNCKHPWFKDVALLGGCYLSEDLSSYTTLGTVAHPNSNSYTVTQTYFSDSACTQETGAYSDPYPILICSYDSLFHVIPQPLNPMTDNLNGFAYGIFSSTSTCQEGSGDGLLEAYYMKLNFCYQDDSGDLMWTNCSNTDETITMTQYSSTNGNCQGVVSTNTWTQADTCSTQQGMIGSGWWYGGPATFVCEN